jgi:hypothetical protein
MILYLTFLTIFRQRNWKYFGKFIASLKEKIQQILLNVFRKIGQSFSNDKIEQ